MCTFNSEYNSFVRVINHMIGLCYFRQVFAVVGGPILYGLTDKDVVYSYLPLYHSSGGQLGTCGAWGSGTKTMIKKKFSASSFWKDCVKYDVTVGLLLAVPILPDYSIRYILYNYVITK